MYVKKGVSLEGLRPEMVAALVILSAHTGGDFVVTSGTEDAPGRIPTSLHPKGLALDIRVPSEEECDGLNSPVSWKQRISYAFEETEYELVWYDTHVHVEFDPK